MVLDTEQDVQSAASPKDDLQSPGSNETNGVNVGAIAGGVVGGVVAIALLAGLIIWLVRRRRKNKLNAKEYQPVRQRAEGTSPAELNETSMPREAAGVPKSELSAREFAASELEGSHR